MWSPAGCAREVVASPEGQSHESDPGYLDERSQIVECPHEPPVSAHQHHHHLNVHHMLHFFVGLLYQFVAVLFLALFCDVAHMSEQINASVFELHVERALLLGGEELLSSLVAAPGIGKEEQVVGVVVGVGAVDQGDVPVGGHGRLGSL